MRCSPTGLRSRRFARARARVRKLGRRRTSASACPSLRHPSTSRRPNSPPASSMRVEGRYRDSFLAAAGADAPKVAAGDMNVIATPVDFVGVNVYLPSSYISASDAAPGFVSVPFPAKHPTMNSSWLKIGPEALYWGSRNVAKVWNGSDIYITENGCSATDVPAAD